MRRVSRTRSVACLPTHQSPDTDTGPRARVRRLLDECVGSDLTSWEKFEFLPSIANRFVLTERQERALVWIEKRVFGEEE